MKNGKFCALWEQKGKIYIFLHFLHTTCIYKITIFTSKKEYKNSKKWESEMPIYLSFWYLEFFCLKGTKKWEILCIILEFYALNIFKYIYKNKTQGNEECKYYGLNGRVRIHTFLFEAFFLYIK